MRCVCVWACGEVCVRCEMCVCVMCVCVCEVWATDSLIASS